MSSIHVILGYEIHRGMSWWICVLWVNFDLRSIISHCNGFVKQRCKSRGIILLTETDARIWITYSSIVNFEMQLLIALEVVREWMSGYIRSCSVWMWFPMDLLPDTYNCGLCMRRECREHFFRHHGLAIPTCITARAWRTCRDACRDR